MKVLHVDCGREMRGGQWQALYLMVGQKTVGVQPLLLARKGSPLAQEAAQRGVPVVPLSWLRLRKLSAAHQITHVHDARSHTMAALVGKGPIVVSRRVAFPIKQGWLSRWKYGRATRYLAVSNFVAGQLQQAGVAAERIVVVYDGVPVNPRPGLGDKLLMPHWNDARKGSALARQAAQLAGLTLSETRDLEKDLPSARALVYLTDMEGLGSAALLAMAHGVPVIASRVGGLPEIVQHEITGLLVNNDAADVAQAMRRLAGDRAFADRLGRQGMEFVRGGFTLADMVLRTYHEYKQVIR
ncbi:MAG: glycosyltransferase family 4 protein [Bryobacterales bacterium]|nr:glycosyltransferase family 4 protein [Bryobacterales bacterium]